MRTIIKQKTLKNGIRVVTSSSKETSFVSYCVSFAAGTVFADKKHSGLAHFFEHCCFHSTNKHSKEEMVLIEKDHAAYSNASTSGRIMDFDGSCFAKDLYTILDLLFERLYDSKYDHKEIEDEKRIVHQEISRSLLDKKKQIFEKINKVLFPSIYVGSFKILGSHEELDDICDNDLKEFAKKYLLPSRMVVSVSGNVNISKLSKYLLKKFPEKSIEQPFVLQQEGEPKVGKNEYIEANLIENNSVKIYLHLTNDLQKGTREHISLSMLASVLSGMGFNSLFYRIIREEKQLVYSIATYLESYGKTEYFCIAFETTKLKDVLTEICNVLVDVAKNGVDERLLNHYKQWKKRSIEKRNEDIYGRPPHLASSKILCDEDCSQKYYDKIDGLALSMTNDDVKSAAKMVLNTGRIVIATDSKLFGEEQAKEFTKLFSKAKKKI